MFAPHPRSPALGPKSPKSPGLAGDSGWGARQVSGDLVEQDALVASLVEGVPTRNFAQWSLLERHRSHELPTLPDVLCHRLKFEESNLPTETVKVDTLKAVSSLQPLRAVACASSCTHEDGGPTRRPLQVGLTSVSMAPAAAGTHNVILGLREFVAQMPGAKLYGIRSFTKATEFELMGGCWERFLNQAGSDMLPTQSLLRVSDRMIAQIERLCDRLGLDNLIFLCGPRELPQVTLIADHFAKSRPSKTSVTAVLHSVSGWLRLPGWLPLNIGFDSACNILAELTGNIMLSGHSTSSDIYHFVCVGSPTLTLEVAMQTHPVLCFIGEDIAERGLTLQGIVDEICDVIVTRHHEHNLHAGVVLVSDNFFEKLLEMCWLRKELNKLRMEQPAAMRSEESAKLLLPPDLGTFFGMLPADVRHALLFRSDIDGMPMLLPQDAEAYLGALVEQNLALRSDQNRRSVGRFVQAPVSLCHVALSPMPTLLDCHLGYALGHVAGALAEHHLTGYVASVTNLSAPCREWGACAVPMASLLEPAPQEGASPVPRRRRLGSNDALFGLFRRVQASWRYRQSYRQPGPAQFWGPHRDTPSAWAPYTLRAESTDAAELAREAGAEEAAGTDSIYTVPLEPPRRLIRRREALLSPLQRWRVGYQPALPGVLRGPVRLTESASRGRVCADLDLVHAALPNLLRAEGLKAWKVEPFAEEVNVLQMLPTRAASGLSAAFASSNSLQGGSPGSEQSSDGGTEQRQSGLRIGFVLAGSSGPGVNNVVQGLFDYLKALDGTVVCIPMGIAGLVAGHAFELDEEMLRPFRNQGGCDLLGESEGKDLLHLGDVPSCAEVARRLRLDGLVVWGGRTVLPWTLRVAEHFAQEKVPTSVVAVPASIHSDLPLLEQTLGYDSVSKLLSSVVGNLATQAASSGKIWFFVRIPGRSVSHIAAEIALATHPHVVLSSSEANYEQLALPEVMEHICNVIEARSKENRNYGIVLIPDQILASVREMKQLLDEVAQINATCPDAVGSRQGGSASEFSAVLGLLTPLSRALFKNFPRRVQAQVCSLVASSPRWQAQGTMRSVRDNAEPMDLSNVDTEVIFQTFVEMELTRRVVLGSYKGPFKSMTYSMAYLGRSNMPSNFDCDLGYTIGHAAGTFVSARKTGLFVDVTHLKENQDDWEVWGSPLASLMTFEDEGTFYIKPRLRLRYDVLGQGGSMPEPCERAVISPGPAQFDGPCAGSKTHSLCMPQLQRVRQMAKTEQLIAELKLKVSAGCPPKVLQAVKTLLQGGVELLKTDTT